MYAYSKPILGLSAIRSATFLELFHDYEAELIQAAYHPVPARLHLHSIAHFGVWLGLEGVSIETIDEETVAAFEAHRPRCRCPGASRNRGRQVVCCVRVFVRHLRDRGIVPPEDASPEPHPLVREFLAWMRADRSVVETTVRSYRQYVGDLVDHVGDDPGSYTARGLRDFVSQRYGHYGRNSIRMVLAAVRMFLRHLAIKGECRAGLEHALLSPANWSQQSLPRGLSSEQVKRVLGACPTTPMGVRDRAILLLLIRLGLRAGDVAGLGLTDLCFDTATVRVSGKGRREVRLPLPQDVGDAVLDYLRVRPRVRRAFKASASSSAPWLPSGRSDREAPSATLRGVR